jgi:signal transduction histidine kinase
MMTRPGWKSTAAYAGLLAAAFLLAVLVSVQPQLGEGLDHWAYDFMFRTYEPPAWHTQSVIVAIDEFTLQAYGGVERLRGPLASALASLAAVRPKAIAIDITLADPGIDPAADVRLAAAFASTPRVVLASDMGNGESWEDPLPQFRAGGAALGQVHTEPDADGITRAIALEKRLGRVRRWALSLEAFRLSRGVSRILESPQDLQVGDTIVPVPRKETDRTRNRNDSRIMRVRYIPADRPLAIPRLSLKKLVDDPSLARQCAGKVVFVGLTAVTALHDRLQTPVAPSSQTAGVEINANAFETMAQGLFLTDVAYPWVLLFSLAMVAAAGLAFRYLPGAPAYLSAATILVLAGAVPYVLFTHRLVLPFSMPALSAALGTMAAAGYYYLVIRRDLAVEHAARTRYQQAMQFVTHEMRTPLSAIQGSSELMTRYPLNEEKRKQMTQLIHSESKRLARMVEVFLNVERLSAGQMELKREAIAVKAMVELCVERVRPLAERKHIAVSIEPVAADFYLSGDRELIEYACYNLLTNAVKYSPQRTEVAVSARKHDGLIGIAVKDQGIGMDQKEVRQIFQKFYRTRKAEESGEAGSGIGLSIVQQIVEQHDGRIEVASEPGAGSCFTVLLPAAQAPASIEQSGVERN